MQKDTSKIIKEKYLFPKWNKMELHLYKPKPRFEMHTLILDRSGSVGHVTSPVYQWTEYDPIECTNKCVKVPEPTVNWRRDGF